MLILALLIMKSDVVSTILCISTIVDEKDPYVLTVERIISHQKMKALLTLIV